MKSLSNSKSGWRPSLACSWVETVKDTVYKPLHCIHIRYDRSSVITGFQGPGSVYYCRPLLVRPVKDIFDHLVTAFAFTLIWINMMIWLAFSTPKVIYTGSLEDLVSIKGKSFLSEKRNSESCYRCLSMTTRKQTVWLFSYSCNVAPQR